MPAGRRRLGACPAAALARLGPTRRAAGWALLGLLLAAPAAAERIVAFEVDVTLGTRDEITVRERIRYDFEERQRHGIYRDIPLRGGEGSASHALSIEVLDVTDAGGESRPHEVSRAGADLRIRIGSPRRKLGGLQDYWIRYRVTGALAFLDDHDEFYWNATGTRWSVPIEWAAARVELPPGVDGSALQARCYTGPAGSRESDCRVDRSATHLTFTGARPFSARDGLTLVLALPKGVVSPPSAASRAARALSGGDAPWALLPLGAAGLVAWLWRRFGRDPAGGAAVPVRYEPPEGMSPAEMGTLLDERVDVDDVTATILDLAIRGHLTIEERRAERFLFLVSKDYELRRLESPADELRSHERALLGALFPAGRTSVRVSELKNRFYRRLPAIRRALYRRLVREERFFPASPERTRNIYRGVGIALLVLAVPLLEGRTFAALCVGLTGGLVLATARGMPRRTRRGRRAYEEILGFREFAQRVDRDRLERTGGRTSGRFERILPYALVLGVADQWADAFADAYSEPPRWYVSSGGGPSSPRVFVSDVGQSLRALGSAMTSSPRGSGLGSGGASGGGSGGGGGGSW